LAGRLERARAVSGSGLSGQSRDLAGVALQSRPRSLRASSRRARASLVRWSWLALSQDNRSALPSVSRVPMTEGARIAVDGQLSAVPEHSAYR
jgi:hypothetical protein